MPNWKWSLKSTTRNDYSNLHLLFLKKDNLSTSKNPLQALSTFSFSCDSFSCRLVTRCNARALSSRQFVLVFAISMASALATTDNLYISFSAMASKMVNVFAISNESSFHTKHKMDCKFTQGPPGQIKLSIPIDSMHTVVHVFLGLLRVPRSAPPPAT